MLTERFELEKIFRIYDNKNSDEYVEIGEDADCLGLVEIRIYTMPDNKIIDRICIDPREVPLLIQALNEVAQSLFDKESKSQKT